MSKPFLHKLYVKCFLKEGLDRNSSGSKCQIAKIVTVQVGICWKSPWTPIHSIVAISDRTEVTIDNLACKFILSGDVVAIDVDGHHVGGMGLNVQRCVKRLLLPTRGGLVRESNSCQGCATS